MAYSEYVQNRFTSNIGRSFSEFTIISAEIIVENGENAGNQYFSFFHNVFFFTFQSFIEKRIEWFKKLFQSFHKDGPSFLDLAVILYQTGLWPYKG